MKRSEARSLVIGILLGLLLGGLIVGGISLNRRPADASVASLPETTAPSRAEQSSPVSLQLSADEQQSIGIATIEVQRRTLQREITAPGKVVEPETGIGVISSRIAGRVDRLLVNVTGDGVNRGQAVAQIYSPEVFTAAEEYRLSLENRRRLSESREPQAIAEADSLIQASRRRLELRGLTTTQIDEIVSSPESSLLITIYSSVSGIVTKRNVAEGQYVAEGEALYTVTDLSTVWVQADIFESDISLIRSGQSVRITAPGLAGALRGTINFLQPSVDPQTRTMMARIQVSNPQMQLKPGMFVQVTVGVPLGDNIVTAPRSAVLESGKQKVVYVAHEGGVFEKRVIEVSAAIDDSYAISSGLEPGERIVTHGNFLLDSQTRLTGSITGMFGGLTPADTVPTANYKITFRTEPVPPRVADDETFHVTVTDSNGQPVTDAQVQVQLFMPAMSAMGMGEMATSFDLNWDKSEYVGKGSIPMVGSWNVTVEARRNGQLLGTARTRLDAR